MRGSHQPLPKPGFAPAEDDGDAVRAAGVGGQRGAAEEGDGGAAVAAAGRGGSGAGGGGRQARHHAADGTPGPRSPDPGPAPLVPVHRAGPRTGHRHQSGAHQGHHHRPRGPLAQFSRPFGHALRRGASEAYFAPPSRHHIPADWYLFDRQEGGFNADDTDWSNLYDLVEPQSRLNSPQKFSGGFPEKDEEGNVDGKQALENQDGLKVLPFEFIALEACLEAACSCLENEATTLEQEAHPALDKLTSKISTLNLERVRQIKSRLVAITGRVQKVRDELEHLLDDDEDMAEMIPAEISLEGNGGSTSYEGDLQNIDNPQEQLYASHLISRGSHGTRTSTTRSAISKQLDVEELEMLLEAYFVQIDGTLNKLSTLREYVDDTEDYINIMLDDKQNHLLQMGVMLTTATLVVSAFVVVAGIFGMNIKIDLFKEEKAGMQEFLWTIGGSATGSIFLYVIAIAWCKHKRLLE
ncbi:magnesium transporter 4 [Actinidia rufa]|uniref:Magnesium transporter n=1 Tax=Actinidia rufa TaxID=165716 RepID=A0A7J0DWC2_9ERIC|nr:magnesium transporter 4 [Actinidia rufa]